MISNESSPRPVNLEKYYPSCILLSWFLFILFECLVIIPFDEDKTICTHTVAGYEQWFWAINHMVLGGFILQWIQLAVNIFSLSHEYESHPMRKLIVYSTFTVVTQGTIATYLALFPEWGGLCIDSLGVASPAAIWGEWIGTGPLLLFIPLSIGQSQLSILQWSTIITFEICLVAGFLIILPYGEIWGWWCFFISCVTYIPVMFLPLLLSSFDRIEEDDGEKESSEEGHHLSTDQIMDKLRWEMTIWLTFIFPWYTINYILAYLNYIGHDMTIAIYQVLSVATKALFVHITFNSHLTYLDVLVMQNYTLMRMLHARIDFVNYISHEIRNPMSALHLGLEILKSGSNVSVASEEGNCLKMMSDATKFMEETLNNVLLLQQLEEGKLVVVEHELNLWSITDEISNMYSFMMKDKGIKFSKQIDQNLPKLMMGDKKGVSHIFGNILSNAIKFSDDGGKIIMTIEKLRTEDGNKDEKRKVWVRASIQDHGCGMSHDMVKTLGTRYAQERPEKLQQGQGSGLGIAFSKRMVDLLGGTLEIKSKLGEGSTFTLAIPFGEASALESASAKVNDRPQNDIMPTTVTKEAPLFSISDMEVLVVDDNESNAKILSMLLKKNALKVMTVSDGQQAVDIIAQDANRFKLVFMDNLMPKLTGPDATKIIRSKYEYTYIIVGATGNVSSDDIADFIEHGVNLVIPKPLSIKQIKKVLSYIEKHGPELSSSHVLVETSGPNETSILEAIEK